jgi:hypothetical protein
VILFCSFTWINFFRSPQNGIAINFGTTEFGSGNVQPTEPPKSIATAAKQAAASNQDILSQDIEEAVVIKQTKNTTFKRNGEKRLNQNRKSQPSKAPLMHCQAS